MDDGRSVGTVSLDQARYLAEQYGLDLVEIAPQARPPVARILDYNKYRYQQEKHARQAGKPKTNQLKEVRLSFGIGPGDLETKAKQAKEFLEEGHFVRVFLNLRGRENLFPEKGKERLFEFQRMTDSVLEKDVSQLGKKIQIIIKPKKRA